MIRIPTPFEVGNVNAYLLRDTLIDTGPATSDAIEALKKSVDLKSIENVIITHGHVDHHGLASELRKISGCRVFVHRDDLSSVTDYKNRLKINLDSYENFLRKAGISEKMLSLFSDYYSHLGRYGESCEAEVLENRFETEAGNLEIIHTSGHTSGSCCFLLDEILYSGDTLLPHISTNPSINAIFDSRCGLEQYRNSLEKISKLTLKEVFPGHGDKIRDHRRRIKEILEEHKERKERIINSLTREKQTLKDISKKIFGEVSPSNLTLALAECYDHLRILEKEGVVEILEDKVYLFRIH